MLLKTLALTAAIGAFALLPGCAGHVGYSHYDRPGYYTYQDRGPYYRPYSPYRYNRPVVIQERRRDHDGFHGEIHVRD